MKNNITKKIIVILTIVAVLGLVGYSSASAGISFHFGLGDLSGIRGPWTGAETVPAKYDNSEKETVADNGNKEKVLPGDRNADEAKGLQEADSQK
ncbi:MAG: hypothetical protein JRJ12_13925 [Deltaproteobacteria bacterium]|nr:hypothetical protein [Deltaproteobacteria bacterium]MBW2072185.1 hypothetical protein [Deltaproteobacteria bacterium]